MDGTKLSRVRSSVERYEPPIGNTPSPSTKKGRGGGGRGSGGKSQSPGGREEESRRCGRCA
jgi:hypothetical protein